MMTSFSPPCLPPISTLHILPPSEVAKVSDLLFERADFMREKLVPHVIAGLEAEWDSYARFIEVVRNTLLMLCDQAGLGKLLPPDFREKTAQATILGEIVGAHPRLGEAKAGSGGSEAKGEKVERVSRQSAGEQAQLAEAAGELGRLNGEYEERFGGLRYVVFVNGRGRDEIMQEMRDRIERGDIGAERRAASNAICDIALDRVQKMGGDKGGEKG